MSEARYEDAILAGIVEDAGDVPGRWLDVAELVDAPPHRHLRTLLDAITRVDRSGWSETERRELWSKLRGLSARHLRFSDAHWALPTELAEEVLNLAERFKPADIFDQVRHLFAGHVDLEDEPTRDVRALSEAVSARRARAVERIWERYEAQGLLRLAEMAEAPWTVGVAAADADLPAGSAQLVETLLSSTAAAAEITTRAYLMRLYDLGRQASVTGVIERARSAGWPPHWRALIYASMEFSPETWRDVDAEGADVAGEYWRMVSYLGRGQLAPDVIREAVDHFVDAGNILAAVDFLALYREDAPAGQVVAVMKRIAGSTELQGEVAGRLATDVLRLLESLQADPSVDQDVVAGLEWQMAPFVRVGPFEPKALEAKLSSDPNFFLEVLSLAFRADDEAPRELATEQEKARARRAFDLLFSWHTPPGLQSDGTVDPTVFGRWIDEAREGARLRQRLAIADLRIGEVMAYMPVDTDGSWPPVPVREAIERLESDEFERGVVIGVANARGVTTRGLGEGGAQERDSSARYDKFAQALRNRWPRTAAVLDRISAQYERDARRMDVEAEWERREALGDSTAATQRPNSDSDATQ